MAESQDWSEVRWDKSGTRSAGVSKKKQLQTAARQGNLEAEKKYGAATNSQSGSTVNMARLEESEELSVVKVSTELKKLLQAERQKAGITQKELATSCNLKATVIQEYESGKAIPNSAILGKIERAIKQKNPAFVLGTFTKAQKKAVEKQKAKEKAAAGTVTSASTQQKKVATTAPKSRRF